MHVVQLIEQFSLRVIYISKKTIYFIFSISNNDQKNITTLIGYYARFATINAVGNFPSETSTAVAGSFHFLLAVHMFLGVIFSLPSASDE